MAKNDFQLLWPTPNNLPPTHPYLVIPGTTSSINVGEFVIKPVGTGSSNYAKAFTASVSTQPLVGSDWIAGFAMSTSTETTTATGFVEVMDLVPGIVFLGNPAAPTSWDTQAEYNLLVGARVLIQNSSGVMTVLATDAWTAAAKNGLIVQYIDITQYPAKVAFSLNNMLSYQNQVLSTTLATNA